MMVAYFSVGFLFAALVWVIYLARDASKRHEATLMSMSEAGYRLALQVYEARETSYWLKRSLLLLCEPDLSSEEREAMRLEVLAVLDDSSITPNSKEEHNNEHDANH